MLFDTFIYRMYTGTYVTSSSIELLISKKQYISLTHTSLTFTGLNYYTFKIKVGFFFGGGEPTLHKKTYLIKA